MPAEDKHGLRMVFLKAQQERHARQQAELRTLISDGGRALRAYQSSYDRAFDACKPRRMQWERLLTKGRRAPLLLAGDFRTLNQAGQTFGELVRALDDGRPGLVLAVDFIPAALQAPLDACLKGRLELKTLERKLPHGRPPGWKMRSELLRLARERGLPVLALEPPRGERALLKRYNSFVALRLARHFEAHPERRVAALIGELHLAPGHLPAALKSLAPRLGTPLVVLQNHAPLYFKLAARRGRLAGVYALGQGYHVLFNTPPVGVLESFLHWARQEQLSWSGSEVRPAFRDILETLSRALSLRLPSAARQVQVCTPADLDCLAELAARGVSSEALESLVLHASQGESYTLIRGGASEAAQGGAAPMPEEGRPEAAVYLASNSALHLGEEAAHLLAHLLGRHRRPLNLADRFYYHVINEALGFAGSRFIVPHRRVPGLGALRADRRSQGAVMVRRHLALERAGQAVEARDFIVAYLSGLKDDVQAHWIFQGAVHALGYRLGDRLHREAIKEPLGKSLLRRLFGEDLGQPGVAFRRYWGIVEGTGWAWNDR